MGRWLAALGALFFLALAAQAEAKLDVLPAFPSSHVMPRQVSVWLPENYDPAGPPMPVLYMQDGENLHEPSHSLSHADWEVGPTATRLIREGLIPPVIIVGIASTPLRGREYLPTKLMGFLPEARRTEIEASWQGPSLADDYLKFLVSELKPYIDAHYRTRTDAAHTFIMGSSMGGLISLYAQSEYPEVFGGSASLSLHMLLGEPWKTMIKDDPAVLESDVISAFDHMLEHSRLTPGDHLIYVDRGDQTLDAYYVPYSLDFDAMMGRHGWRPGSGYQSRTFPGTAHDERAWAARLDVPLQYLLGGK